MSLEIKTAEDLKSVLTTEKFGWKVHDSFGDYETAFNMVGFYKNQGYLGTHIRMVDETHYDIMVLMQMRGN